MNGIYVSDSYVRVQIEKIFSMSKFMDYEREKKERIRLKNLENKKKSNEKTFLGRKLVFPDLAKTEGGYDFVKDLNEKLNLRNKHKEDDALNAKGEGKFNLHNYLS
jgi:hypothetical protein